MTTILLVVPPTDKLFFSLPFFQGAMGRVAFFLLFKRPFFLQGCIRLFTKTVTTQHTSCRCCCGCCCCCPAFFQNVAYEKKELSNAEFSFVVVVGFAFNVCIKLFEFSPAKCRPQFCWNVRYYYDHLF